MVLGREFFCIWLGCFETQSFRLRPCHVGPHRSPAVGFEGFRGLMVWGLGFESEVQGPSCHWKPITGCDLRLRWDLMGLGCFETQSFRLRPCRAGPHRSPAVGFEGFRGLMVWGLGFESEVQGPSCHWKPITGCDLRLRWDLMGLGCFETQSFRLRPCHAGPPRKCLGLGILKAKCKGPAVTGGPSQAVPCGCGGI